jgi:cytoskeletal protein CcmA (bactofilin family)
VRGFIKKVSVGGSFKAEEAIEIEDLDVGGTAKVGQGSKITTVDIGGTFKADGDFEFGEINVGGTVKLAGDAKGRTIDVGGTVKTDGNLEVTEGLNVGGTVAVGGNLKSDGKIKVGGTVRTEGRIDTFRIIVGGEIQAEYIRATDGFRIGKRAEVRGFVESNEILIRERARTDSLYGNDIRIEERARVASLYGKTIYIEREAYVEGEVLYTDSLEYEDGVTFREEPKKVKLLNGERVILPLFTLTLTG